VVGSGVSENFDDSLDLRQFAATLLARKWFVLISVIAFTSLSLLALFILPPVYRASAVLIPANLNSPSGGLSSSLGQLGGLASLAGISVQGGSPDVAEAISVLGSREFSERFVADNNLMPVLFASKWDSAANRWKSEVTKIPTPQKAYERINKMRSIIQDKKTGLVTIQIDWRDRDQAAAWANDMVQRLNSEMRNRAIARAEASVGYLERERAATTDFGVQQAINRLIENEIQKKMIANVTKEYSFRVVDRAIAADADEPVFPNKILFAALGPVAGFMFAILWLLGKAGFAASPRNAGVASAVRVVGG
jgi:uncharacterized protein involved in exopolysaccharide biosynthesis